MQGNQVGFESSFQQHLDSEQRRAVLEAIGTSINPDSTLGEILDAAEALGWSDKMGDLSLADLAEALLAPEGDEDAALGAEDEEDEDLDEGEEDEDLDEDEDLEEDEDDEFELVVQEPVAPRRKTKKASAKKAASKKTAKKAAKKAPYTEKTSAKKAAKKAPYTEKTSAKKAAKKAPAKKAAKKAPYTKKTAKKAPSVKKASKGHRKLTAVDVDDRMSLDQAAEFFLPYVEDLGEATMQALEEQTGVSRRKLRFHVGQLVKHGYLERHGMGRGTFYTRT